MTSSDRSRTALTGLAFLLAGLVCSACSDDLLSRQVPSVRIVPLPQPGQRLLSGPPGIDLGDVPLYGRRRALFEVRNESTAVLKLLGVEPSDVEGGRLIPFVGDGDAGDAIWPILVDAGGWTTLHVDAIATADGEAVRGRVALETNAGPTGGQRALVRVEGVGVFVGEPLLRIAYQGGVYPEPGDCQGGQPDEQPICILPPLHLGPVAQGSTTSDEVVLSNAPAPDTCHLPLRDDGTADCSPVCVLTVDRDPQAWDVGIGCRPADAGFALVGSTAVPFDLHPDDATCNDVRQNGAPLRLVVTFDASVGAPTDPEGLGDAHSSLLVESNAANAPRVQIPITATVRQGPVAVARLRACDAQMGMPGVSCSIADAISPLAWVYFDGSDSYDPSAADGEQTLADYRWQVVESPPGTVPEELSFEGQGTALPRLWLPLAGRYVVRLHVSNELGLQSVPGPLSDVELLAIEDGRLHVQLTWDDPDLDLDLHLVHAESDGRVYNAFGDCFWHNCQPAVCGNDETCSAVQWFATAAPFVGPNPRLDVDDTQGLGPENVIIEAPEPGRYRAYVHYYGLVSQHDSPTSARVRVSIDGMLRMEYVRELQRDDLWAVVQIGWLDDADDAVSNGPSALLTPARADGPNAPGAVTPLPYLPYPEGLDFSEVF